MPDRSTTNPKPARKAARLSSKEKTKWGDREGRRRDILDAARGQMLNGGYLALNMRDIAARAGVSPGTLYSYFATKEEIFATLYAEAIADHNARIEPVCAAATDLEPFLADLATSYLDLYAAYGRYFTMWSALADPESLPDDPRMVSHASPDPVSRDVVAALREATVAHGQLTLATVRRLVGPAAGRMVDEPIAMTFVWTVLNGVGDHVTSERRHLTPFTTDELIRFATATLVAGLLAPSPPATPRPGH